MDVQARPTRRLAVARRRPPAARPVRSRCESVLPFEVAWRDREPDYRIGRCAARGRCEPHAGRQAHRRGERHQPQCRPSLRTSGQCRFLRPPDVVRDPAELVGKVAHRLPARVRRFARHLFDHPLQAPGDVWRHARERRGLAFEDRGDDLRRTVASRTAGGPPTFRRARCRRRTRPCERPRAGRGSARAPCRATCPSRRLAPTGPSRSSPVTASGSRRRPGTRCQPEVQQLGAGSGEHDVAGLQIAMDNAGTMGGVERRGDLTGVAERVRERQRTSSRDAWPASPLPAAPSRCSRCRNRRRRRTPRRCEGG